MEPTVVVKAREADRIARGHPWIYEGSFRDFSREPQDGEVVEVRDARTKLLGYGFYNSKSKINVRIISAERFEPNEAFFEERIRAALDLRKKYLPSATSFRLLNAESDFLSGLIVDKYEDILVLQISSLGMDRRKEAIVKALVKVIAPSRILERSDIGTRKFEGLTESQGILFGEPASELKQQIQINGLKFEVDLLGGHKTGMYLDQQTNYEAVGRLARGNVLDCFTFLGGFALHAARASAVHVHALDQSEEAITAAAKHAQINGLAEKMSFETINVFDWLKKETTVGPHEKLIPRYDTIILDPPSFTRTRAAVQDALRGYKEIHLRALKLLKRGGTLATFCCSHHVPAPLFEEVILDAAFDARRTLRRVATYSQSPDHPVIPTIPETEYLKGFAYEIVR